MDCNVYSLPPDTPNFGHLWCLYELKAQTVNLAPICDQGYPDIPLWRPDSGGVTPSPLKAK